MSKHILAMAIFAAIGIAMAAPAAQAQGFRQAPIEQNILVRDHARGFDRRLTPKQQRKALKRAAKQERRLIRRSYNLGYQQGLRDSWRFRNQWGAPVQGQRRFARRGGFRQAPGFAAAQPWHQGYRHGLRAGRQQLRW